MTKNTITPHQQIAFNTLLEFLSDDEQRMAILEGYAGTGKTFLMGEFIKLAKDKTLVCVAAPTHKALKVICSALEASGVTIGTDSNQEDAFNFSGGMANFYNRKKQETGVCSATIHSLLALKMTNQENGESICKQDIGKAPSISDYGLVVIDESSLISRQMFELIMTHKKQTKVLFIGDPAQLLPVEDKNQISPVFTCVDIKARLNEIVRQAMGNPIIKLSMAIRSATEKFSVSNLMAVLPPLPADAACVSGNASDLVMYTVAEQMTGRDARVICYRNETVKGINQRVHDTIHPGTLFGIGERVLCYFSAGAAGDKSPFKVFDANGGVHREHKARLMDEFTVIGCDETEPDNNLPVMELTLETGTGLIVKTLVPINRRAYESAIEQIWINYRDVNTAFNLARANTPEKEALRKEKLALSGRAYAMINRYPDLRHAYAMTVHRSQGSTFDTALVHYNDLNTMRSAFEFNRALYVACTRPRQYLAVVV
jgi:exodeoxyribonuclease-5